MMPQVSRISNSHHESYIGTEFQSQSDDAVKGGTYYPITVKVGEPPVTPLHVSDMH